MTSSVPDSASLIIVLSSVIIIRSRLSACISTKNRKAVFRVTCGVVSNASHMLPYGLVAATTGGKVQLSCAALDAPVNGNVGKSFA